MTTQEERLVALASLAKDTLKNLRQCQKIRGPVSGEPLKRARMRQETANEGFRQHERNMHELHCLCVELGIAALEPSRYGEKLVQISMGRQIKEVRRNPCQKSE